MQYYGHKLITIVGPSENIKITTAGVIIWGIACLKNRIPANKYMKQYL